MRGKPGTRDGHGTNSMYSYGCRCDDCRNARVRYNRERRVQIEGSRGIPHPVRCGNCRMLIEACDGVWGDWMHTGSKRERCVTGDLATPEKADTAR